MPQCRCSNRRCRHRATLPMKPSQYLRPRRCARCGRKDAYQIDKYRCRREKAARKTCFGVKDDCFQGYHYPHAWGRGFCVHNPNPPHEGSMARRGWSTNENGDADEAPPF